MEQHELASGIIFQMGPTYQGGLNCRKAQLTIKAQERISAEPKVTFSLTDEEIQDLQNIATTRAQIVKHKNELFTPLPISNQLSNSDHLNKYRDLEYKLTLLNHQLNLVQKLEKLQLLEEIKSKSDSQSNKKPEQNLFKYLEQNQIPKEDMILGCTTLIDLNAQLYREIEAIQQFVEFKSDKLFGTTKSICPFYINDITIGINALVDVLETLSQEQASDK